MSLPASEIQNADLLGFFRINQVLWLIMTDPDYPKKSAFYSSAAGAKRKIPSAKTDRDFLCKRRKPSFYVFDTVFLTVVDVEFFAGAVAFVLGFGGGGLPLGFVLFVFGGGIFLIWSI